MKNVITIIFMLVISDFVRGQWFVQEPMPSGAWDFQFVNQENGWVAGSYGKILKTTTGGNSWFHQNSGTSQHLRALYFINEEVGWVAGWAGTILKTTDGGTNWNPQSSGVINTLRDIFFLDELNGYASGEQGTLLKTTNGGDEWLPLVSPTNYFINGIWFNDVQNGVLAASSEKIYKTSNSGETWELVFNQIGYSFNSLAFNDSIGIAAGGWYGEILRSTDYGNTWTDIPTGVNTNMEFFHVCSNGINNWTAVGYTGIYSSSDAGASWQRKLIGVWTRLFHSSAFKDSATAFAFGRENQQNIMYKTTNGGNTWVQAPATFTDKTLNAISYTGSLAVGDHGTILKSSGGTEWLIKNSGTEKNLYSVDLNNGTHGTAVGDSGIIIRTSDAGNSWSIQNSGTLKRLNGVSFAPGDYYNGFAVGDEGFVIKTTDGGMSWINLSSGVSENLYSVYFTDPLQGAVCGDNGIIIRTTDAGNTWITVPPVTNMKLNGIAFDKLNIDCGWVVGEDETILKTSDSGNSWIIQHPGGYVDLNGIAIGNINEVYAAGSHGRVLKTTNGGSTWGYQYTGSGNFYLVSKAVGVSPNNSNYAIIVGESGVIFKTTNGGVIPPNVPVEITSFTAVNDGSSITLTWSTATEVNNRGFEIERKTGNIWRTIGFVSGKGTSSEINDYSFIDDLYDYASGSIVFYRLKQVDYDGSFEYSGEVEITFAPAYSLSQNYPNPFNPSTKISYTIPVSSKVSLKVYNVLGKEVATLVNQSQNPGNYEVEFNAESLSTGVYFYTLTAGNKFLTKKLLLLK